MRSLTIVILLFIPLFSICQYKKTDSVLFVKKLKELGKKNMVIHSGNASKYQKYLEVLANSKQLPLNYYVPAKKPND